MDGAKITSGKVAANNSFCWSDDRILELFKDQQTNKNTQQEICDEKRRTLQQSDIAFL